MTVIAVLNYRLMATVNDKNTVGIPVDNWLN